MKATIENGSLKIDVYDLTESLSEEDRETFMRSVIFQEELLNGVVNTLATGETFPGFWSGDMAFRLRQQVLPLMPQIVQELFLTVVREKVRFQEKYCKLESAVRRLSRHWPQEVTPNECNASRPEFCVCAFNRDDVAAFLSRELGEDWQAKCEVHETTTPSP